MCAQEPIPEGVNPQRGPQAGGTSLTITGKKLLTGRASDISVLLGSVPCVMYVMHTHTHYKNIWSL